jgi:hypothetical protein
MANIINKKAASLPWKQTVYNAIAKAARPDGKAYIYLVYVYANSNLSLGAFKAELFDMFRNHEVILTRADLVPRKWRITIDASEITYGDSTFHMVEKGRGDIT